MYVYGSAECKHRGAEWVDISYIYIKYICMYKYIM